MDQFIKIFRYEIRHDTFPQHVGGSTSNEFESLKQVVSDSISNSCIYEKNLVEI